MTHWVIHDQGLETFSSWDQTLGCAGESINANPMSSLDLVEIGQRQFYVKHYFERGRHLRRYLGRSRARAEYENLLYFQSRGIPTAPVIAFGEHGREALLVTEAITGAVDLACLVRRDRGWFGSVSNTRVLIDSLAHQVRLLHDDGFIHGDLKWRNLLVNPDIPGVVYIIDCPLGMQLWGPLKSRGMIKDLACLDKVGKQVLTPRQRLLFYQRYAGIDKLDALHRGRIRKILEFFDGRE